MSEKKSVSTNNKAAASSSTMKILKRAKTINFFNDATKRSEQLQIVAVSEKSYKLSNNKTVAKKTIDENENRLKNTIDYRYNVTEDDAIYTQIQTKLCKLLEIEANTDIRAFEKIFSVKETKRYYNILTSDSVILNRASSIELLLTAADNDKLKDKYSTTAVEKTETKLDKYTKHVKDTDFYSVVLKTKADIEKAAALLR